MPTTLCLDFLMFPDDTPMHLPFTLAGFQFAFFSTGVQAFVNESGGGKGLQSPDQGLKVLLPLPVTRLSLTLGEFASPIQITLSNSLGATGATATTASPNAYSTQPFALRRKVSLVTLRGGTNEGVLSKLCIAF
jgi:hypothetical protein